MDMTESLVLKVLRRAIRERHLTNGLIHHTARAELAQYIRYYNFERKHSAIEYLKPAQFEDLINQPE